MKKNYAIFLIVLVCTTSFNSNAQSVSLPQAMIAATPLGTLENNGSSTAGFTFTETSGTDVPSIAFGEPNVSISVDLNYVELTDFDINLVTGSLLDYFTPSYDVPTSILLFKQHSLIPGDWSGAVEFAIDVIQNSTQAQSFNGINANIAALDANTNAEGNASVYTYTDESVLSVITVDALLMQVSPNPTSGVFTIALEQYSDAKVELFDILGKSILSKTYINRDTIPMNIDHLASATYLLKVTSNRASNTVKIIKD